MEASGSCCFPSNNANEDFISSKEEKTRTYMLAVIIILAATSTAAGTAGYFIGSHSITTGVATGLITLAVGTAVFCVYRQCKKSHKKESVHRLAVVEKPKSKAETIRELHLRYRLLANLKFKIPTEDRYFGTSIESINAICVYIDSHRKEYEEQVMRTKESVMLSSKKTALSRSLMFAYEEDTQSMGIYILFNKDRDGYVDKGSMKVVRLALNFDEMKFYASFSAHNMVKMFNGDIRTHATHELAGFKLTKGLKGFLQLKAYSPLYERDASKLRKSFKHRFITDLFLQGNLRQNTHLPIWEKMQFAREAIEMVTGAHNRRILIRDFKLDNILYGQISTRMCDMGMLCKKDEPHELREVLGTLELLSPECSPAIDKFLNKQQEEKILAEIAATTTEARDIWALGVSLYELFTRQRVTLQQRATLFQPGRKLDFSRAMLPPDSFIPDLIERMLNCNPKLRITSKELEASLQLFNLEASSAIK